MQSDRLVGHLRLVTAGKIAGEDTWKGQEMASNASCMPRVLILLAVFQMALLHSLRAQEPVQTVPSGPTPPAGTTNFEAAKALADLIVAGLSKLENLSIDFKYKQWLKQNEAEIARVMPQQGGVLIRVQIAEEANTGDDMPQHHFFHDAFIAATGKNQTEAERNYLRDNQRLMPGPPAGYQLRSENRWIPSTAPPTVNPALAAERLGVERLVSQLEGEVQTERARLDLEWAIIQRLNQEVNNLRIDIGPEAPQNGPDPQAQAKSAFDREEQRIDDWKAAEQRAINSEQAAIGQEAAVIQSLRQALATYITNWRCPVGLTLEVCELPQNQNPARTIHLAERQATRAERASRQAEINRRSQLLASRQARLSARIASLPRQAKILAQNAQKALDHASAGSTPPRGQTEFQVNLKLGLTPCPPGEEWKGQLDKNLEESQIILLLISPSFLASDYCYDIETKRALDRHDKGEAKVIPVLLRPVDWEGAPFARLQGLPIDLRPVTTWPNRDEAFRNIAQGIRRVVEGMTPSPQ